MLRCQSDCQDNSFANVADEELQPAHSTAPRHRLKVRIVVSQDDGTGGVVAMGKHVGSQRAMSCEAKDKTIAVQAFFYTAGD